jgi:enterochelin esterase family protein
VWHYRTGAAAAAHAHAAATAAVDANADTYAAAAHATHATRPDDLPLVLLLDGHYWARQMPIFPVLDAMTAADELPPALYVLIDAIAPEHRTRELPCNPAFWMAVQEELLPELRALEPFTSDPRRTVVAGQSFGGLSAMYAALRWPERFGRVLSQSGSFWWPESDPGQRGGWLARELRAGLCSGHVLEVDMEVGCYEDDMKLDNRAMRDALAASGHRVHYGEFRGGHDWYCWRDGLLQGLARLLDTLPKDERP